MEQVLNVQEEITIAELIEYRCNLIKDIFTFFEKLKLATPNKYIQIRIHIELIVSKLKTTFSEFNTDSNFRRSFDGELNQTLIEQIPPIKFTNFFITVERRIVSKQLRKVLEFWIKEAIKSDDIQIKEFLNVLNAILEQYCLPNIRTIDNQLVNDTKELQTFIYRPDINVTELLLIHKGLIESKDVIHNSAELIEQIELRLLEFNQSVDPNIKQDGNQDEINFDMLLEIDDIEFKKLLEVDEIDFDMLLEQF